MIIEVLKKVLKFSLIKGVPYSGRVVLGGDERPGPGDCRRGILPALARH